MPIPCQSNRSNVKGILLLFYLTIYLLITLMDYKSFDFKSLELQ